MNWYLKVLREYANFEGRAHRQEYWMFALFNVLFSIATTVLDFVLGLKFFGPENGGLLNIVYSLVLFVPGLAVAVRRLHDVGKSGWTLLWMLLPIIGWIYIIILYVRDSDLEANEYGENPKSLV